MFTSKSSTNDDPLVEIEKVVNGSKGRPFLLGRVVSGCMVGAALFLLFFMVVLGMPELGVTALIIDMVLVAVLIGGAIIFFKTVQMRIKKGKLARNKAMTVGRVVDRRLGVW